jgi:hypothetical protein
MAGTRGGGKHRPPRVLKLELVQSSSTDASLECSLLLLESCGLCGAARDADRANERGEAAGPARSGDGGRDGGAAVLSLGGGLSAAVGLEAGLVGARKRRGEHCAIWDGIVGYHMEC